MSKSNLRQPKSFNFGFPDSSEEDEKQEEKEVSQKSSEDILEEVKKPTLPNLLLKKKVIPTLSTNFNDDSQDNSDVKGSGTTGATSDSELQVST